MTRDDLESALAEEFDADHLSVYGDYLQALGDPRGELIALDLDGTGHARERRAELIEQWLGGGVAELLAKTVVEHGFIEDLYVDGEYPGRAELLDAILAGPGGPYIRGATIVGEAAWIRTAIEKLATRPHRWLQRLSVQITDGSRSPAVAGELAAALTRAMPRLEQLEVWGRRVLGDFTHPRLRSLRVTGWDAVDSLIDGPRPLPAVSVLDLAFCVESGHSPSRRTLESMRWHDRLPKLRRLDLSRNEPGTTAPHHLGGHADPIAFLAGIDVRDQLTHVRLPSVQSQDRADHLAVAIAQMPALRELAIVRSYRELAHIYVVPSVRLPEPWPWPPASTAVDRSIMAMIWTTSEAASFFTRPSIHRLPLEPIVLWLEEHFEQLPLAVQTPWLELFGRLADYPGDEILLSAPATASMLEMLDDRDDLDPWCLLRSAIGMHDQPAFSVSFRL